MGRPRKPRVGAFNNLNFSVENIGPHIIIDAYVWKMLKAVLEKHGALIREIHPNREVAQRVWSTPPGVKPKSNKETRSVTKKYR